MKTYYIAFLLLFALFPLPLLSQDIANVTDHSTYKYYYSISSHEAEKICHRGASVIKESYFHTLVDSLPLKKDEENPVLKPGNYLVVWTDKDLLHFEYLPVLNCFPEVFNNNTDLVIFLSDSTGRMVADAMLSIDGHRIRFDSESGTYREPYSNRKGVLSIDLNGVSTCHLIQRSQNNPGIKRVSNKILYTIPIKYIWIPVKLVIHSPYDLVQWVVKGRRTGIWYYLTQPFVTIYRSIYWGNPTGFIRTVFSWFDSSYCTRNTQGYLAFDKPMYRPEDTLYFKALVLNENYKPVSREKMFLKIEEGNYSVYEHFQPWILDTIEAYRPGAFKGSIVLSQCNGLKSNQKYWLSLNSPSELISLSGSFKYEDYELKSNVYELKLDSYEHFRGYEIKISLSAKDDNGLPVADARVKLSIKPSQNVRKTFSPIVLIPDITWEWEGKLNPDGTLELGVPDSVFPRANLGMAIFADFLDAGNESYSTSQSFVHYWENEEVKAEWEDNQIRLDYYRNGIKENAVATLLRFRGEFVIDSMETELSTLIPANQAVDHLLVRIGGSEFPISMYDLSPDINLRSRREQNRLILSVSNPHQLPFYYFLYRNNHVIKRGNAVTYADTIRAGMNENYYCCLIYRWTNLPIVMNYNLALDKNKLNISTNLPPFAYPGQELDLKVKVSDHKGKPVQGADITGLGWTAKFNEDIPGFAIHGESKQRTLINSFDIDYQNFNKGSYTLLYDRWAPRFSLDTMDYYKFRYPEKAFYVAKTKSETRASLFAPFVFDKGRPVPVYHIYIDYVPVYMAEATNFNPYIFRISEGRHTIKIRTAEKWIELGNYVFEAGYRYFISFDMDKLRDLPPRETKNERYRTAQYLEARDMNSYYTAYEERLLEQRMIRVINNFGEKPAYIRQGSAIYLMTGPPNMKNVFSRTLYQLGPLTGEQLHFVNLDRLTVDIPFASDYTYEFNNTYSDRFRVIDNKKGKKRLPRIRAVLDLDDMPVKETDLILAWEQWKKDHKTVIRYPSVATKTKKGNGTIRLDKELSATNSYFRNHLLSGLDGELFSMIYPGYTLALFDIPPGTYAMLSLYNNNSSIRVDSFKVFAGGTTYLQYTDLQIRAEDRLTVSLDSLIQAFASKYDAGKGHIVSDYEMNEIMGLRESYKQEIPGTGRLISGIVAESESGEPLPGVSVYIKGTTNGTITDYNGFYQIRVPENSTLVFAFIGFESIETTASEVQNVSYLNQSAQSLDEVIVTGYGVQPIGSVCYSVTHVRDESQFLKGKMAGVQVTSAAGSTSTITIRGAASLAPDELLIVIDGKVYDGDKFDLSPELIASAEVLKGEAATSLYGARAASGVLVITTNLAGIDGSVPSDLPGYAELMKLSMEMNDEVPSGLRSNFSDKMFWAPALLTDENGEAQFSVTLPDDITQWKSGFLVYADRKRAATYRTTVKSFKPVSGQLTTPRFLVEGDSSFVIGRTRNYTGDTLNGQRSFSIGDSLLKEIKGKFAEIAIDTALICAPAIADSFSLIYLFTKDDGYFDGEKRMIPVLRKGSTENTGQFYALYTDSSIMYTPEFPDLPVRVTARASMLDELLDEIKRVDIYPYLCNEQMASKLLALLYRQKIMEYQGRDFGQKRDVNKMIRKLEDNQNDDGLWSWWNRGISSEWISCHVLRSLKLARELGYKVELDSVAAYGGLRDLLLTRENEYQKAGLYEALLSFSSDKVLIQDIDHWSRRNFKEESEFLAAQHVRALAGLTTDLDSIMKMKKETLYGNWYWTNSSDRIEWNSTITTLNVLEILSADSSMQGNLSRIRGYFLEKKSNECNWGNTYQTMRIIAAILPGLLREKTKAEAIRLELDYGKKIELSNFPLDTILYGLASLEATKSGNGPLYLSFFQEFHNPEPEPVEDPFRVRTWFENSSDSLVAGQAVKLHIDLQVMQKGEYIMLKVPIPAGCSYGDQAPDSWSGPHVEYYKDHAGIFYEKLNPGNYHYTIELIPRYSGAYTLNPAVAEWMYFPVKFGRNALRKVWIGEED